MSLKARLRKVEAGVRWLETEGIFRKIELQWKLLQKKQEIADTLARDPAAAARWRELGIDDGLPPPSVPVLRLPPTPEPAPAQPHPEKVWKPRRLEGWEHAPRPEPTLDALRAPEDEGVRGGPAPEAAQPHLEEPHEVRRLEGSEPAPEPGQPTSPPSPDMEIRPTRWRPRGPQDYADDAGPPYFRCLTEYDVLPDEPDDDP